MSSNKIKAPNEKGNSFLWAVAVIVIAIAVIIGFVVVNNKKHDSTNSSYNYPNDSVSFQENIDGSSVKLAKDGVATSVPVVDLYDDLSCPHCADLESSTADSMLKAINDGKLVVNIRTMNFLDKGNNEGHSSKAFTALYTVAKDGDAKLYWNYRKMLFARQADIYGTWNYDDFANAAKDMGGSDTLVNDIKSAKYHDTALKMASDNEKELTDEAAGTEESPKQVSSPRVFVNGKELQLQGTSDGKFEDWIPQAETGKAS